MDVLDFVRTRDVVAIQALPVLVTSGVSDIEYKVKSVIGGSADGVAVPFLMGLKRLEDDVYVKFYGNVKQSILLALASIVLDYMDCESEDFRRVTLNSKYVQTLNHDFPEEGILSIIEEFCNDIADYILNKHKTLGTLLDFIRNSNTVLYLNVLLSKYVSKYIDSYMSKSEFKHFMQNNPLIAHYLVKEVYVNDDNSLVAVSNVNTALLEYFDIQYVAKGFSTKPLSFELLGKFLDTYNLSDDEAKISKTAYTNFSWLDREYYVSFATSVFLKSVIGGV